MKSRPNLIENRQIHIVLGGGKISDFGGTVPLAPLWHRPWDLAQEVIEVISVTQATHAHTADFNVHPFSKLGYIKAGSLIKN